MERKVVPMGLFMRGRTPTPEEAARQALEESLRDTQVRIAQAYAGFNTAEDGELVESFIYEIQAQKARYSYLLRQRKALEGGAAPAALSRRDALPVG